MKGPTPFTGLVADDLTGATDSAVQFAAAGWDARLVRHLAALARPDLDPARPRLEAVTTNARARSDHDAALVTSAAVAALVAIGVERLFVKVDSTVRGSVAGQVAGALTAWRHRHPDALAIICPAFPDHGRTVVAGTVLVHGEPVAASPAASDPVTPVRVSSFDLLFPGSRSLALDELVHDPGPGAYVVDASTDEDLDLIAATLERLGPRAIAVGSAGLAGAIASRSSTTRSTAADGAPRSAGRVLVAVSSLHPVARTQLAHLLETFPPAAPADLKREDPLAVVVVATPLEVSTARPSLDVAAVLAGQVADELSRHRYDALVLIGGDGAHAVLDELQAAEIEIAENLSPGTPRGTVVGGAAHGLQVVTRSGGFGAVEDLTGIVHRLRQPSRSDRSLTHHRPGTPEDLT